MRSRTAVLAALLAVGTAGGIGHAKAVPCNLVKDAKNDTFLVRYQQTANELGAPAPYGPQEDPLDITSVDIATNNKTLTAVIRVVKLAHTSATGPAGISFRVQFATPTLDGDTNLYVDGKVQNGVASFTAGSRAILANLSTKLADATGTFDLAKSEVRIHVPLTVYAPVAKIAKGTKILFNQSDGGALDQTSARIVAVNPTNNSATAAFADVTTSEAVYTAGNVNCVKPGK